MKLDYENTIKVLDAIIEYFQKKYEIDSKRYIEALDKNILYVLDRRLQEIKDRSFNNLMNAYTLYDEIQNMKSKEDNTEILKLLGILDDDTNMNTI